MKIFSTKADQNVFRNIVVLALGSGSARLIGLASMPVITRIYSPEDIGLLSIFTAIVFIASPLLSLRYVVAVPLPSYDRLAINIVVASSLLIFFNITIVIFLAIIVPIIFSDSKIVAQLAPYKWIIVLSIVSTSIHELATLWGTRKRKFKILAKNQFSQAFIGASTKIALGLCATISHGLLIGYTLQQLCGALMLFFSLKSSFFKNKNSISLYRIRFLLCRYSEMVKYRLPSQILMVLAAQIPLFFAISLFDTKIVGQLGLALTTIGLPIQLFGYTTSKAYYAEIAGIGNKHPNKILSITKSIIVKLILLSLMPCISLMLFGPYMFNFVFGDQWGLAGQFASLLSVYLFFQFISVPLVNVFNVFNKQKKFLGINTFRITLIIACFTLSYFINLGAEDTILIYSIALSMHYVFVIYQVFRCLQNEVKKAN